MPEAIEECCWEDEAPAGAEKVHGKLAAIEPLLPRTLGMSSTPFGILAVENKTDLLSRMFGVPVPETTSEFALDRLEEQGRGFAASAFDKAD